VTAKASKLPIAWGYTANLLVILLLVLPLLVLASSALRTERDLLEHPHNLLPTRVTFDNVVNLALGRQGNDLPAQGRFYPQAFLNSAVISFSVAAIVSVLGSLSAYSIARLGIWGGHAMAYGALALRMIPLFVLIIPLYAMFARLQLLGTPLAIILPQAGLFLPYTIWILIGQFSAIPRDLEDAARIDGCSRFGAFLRIVVPLSAPGLTANAVIIFLLSWNDLLLPMIMTNRVEQMTLPVLISSFVTSKYLSYSVINAAGLLATIPVLLLAALLQRYVVHGLTAGAVKG
jgi:multiple sugar transport system permease protein